MIQSFILLYFSKNSFILEGSKATDWSRGEGRYQTNAADVNAIIVTFSTPNSTVVDVEDPVVGSTVYINYSTWLSSYRKIVQAGSATQD